MKPPGRKGPGGGSREGKGPGGSREGKSFGGSRGGKGFGGSHGGKSFGGGAGRSEGGRPQGERPGGSRPPRGDRPREERAEGSGPDARQGSPAEHRPRSHAFRSGGPSKPPTSNRSQDGERSGPRPGGRPPHAGKPRSASFRQDGDRPRSAAPRTGGAPRGPIRGPVGLEARTIAVDLVATVQRGRLLDQLLDEGRLAERYQALDPRDRAMVRAIVGVTLRRWGQIEDALGRFLERPLPEQATRLKAILAVAAAQILFMQVADHASVALAVDLVAADKDGAPFKGLSNAILRRVAQNKVEILADQDAVALDTPAWMLERWSEAYGVETARAVAESHLVEPSLDLSVKADPAGWAERLGGIVLPTGSVRLVSHGAIEKLPGYDEGAWWVQDAAATLPVRLLGDVRGKKVADLCAAPGGKTAMLAHLGADVTAVDISFHRLARLQRNLHRLGLKANVVTADLTEWIGGPFDMILLDAPCTATGTLRRHPAAAVSKSVEDVAKLAAVQRRLIDQAIRSLRPGGLIVYSTCSLEPEEGPDQIRRLMLIDAPVERVPVMADEVFGLSEIVTADGDIRTLPTHLPHADPRLSGLDGFYAARLRRRI